MGFEPESLGKLKATTQKPVGMVLVTGPTGSGKTHTLYSAISVLNKPDVNVMAVEDPVEIHLPGYKGRIGHFEVMAVSDDIREAFMVDASEAELKRRAVAEGLITLRQSGLVKILEQITTIEEIARETSL